MEVTDCEDPAILGMDFVREHVKMIDVDNVPTVLAETVVVPAPSEMVIDGDYR